MENDKKVVDIEWKWAVKQVEDVVSDRIQRLGRDPVLTFAERELLKSNIEQAWKRILAG
jgi:hypothetical protein